MAIDFDCASPHFRVGCKYSHITEPAIDGCRGNGYILLLKHLDLTIKRKVVHIFVNDDIGQQGCPCIAFCYWKCGHGCCDNLFFNILGRFLSFNTYL